VTFTGTVDALVFVIVVMLVFAIGVVVIVVILGGISVLIFAALTLVQATFDVDVVVSTAFEVHGIVGDVVTIAVSDIFEAVETVNVDVVVDMTVVVDVVAVVSASDELTVLAAVELAVISDVDELTVVSGSGGLAGVSVTVSVIADAAAISCCCRAHFRN
jgi:hypothetical protein